jgi:hypothetical protein
MSLDVRFCWAIGQRLTCGTPPIPYGPVAFGGNSSGNEHLIDMEEVTMRAWAVERALADGVQITVTGEDRDAHCHQAHDPRPRP